MKYDLPCEIVQDLLPSYIDGLVSDCSTESVEAHLKQCSVCGERYETMKKEYRNPAVRNIEFTADHEQEKTLFRTIQKRVNKNVRKTACAGIAGVLLVAVMFYVLFDLPLKQVSIEDVQISAHVYDMTQMQNVQPDEMIVGEYPAEDMTVVISKGEEIEENELITITIPDNQEVVYRVTDAVLSDCPYVTSIEYHSLYHLRDMNWEYKNIGDQRILYITDIRTTLLNNKSDGWNTVMTTLEFSKVDKIVYVDDDGAETILWEYEA